MVLKHKNRWANKPVNGLQPRDQSDEQQGSADMDCVCVQDEYEAIDAVYMEEKKQLNELEDRFHVLEAEYNRIMDERRRAREVRETAERHLQTMIRASLTIQAFWRSFKVRKAIKAKKRRGAVQKKGKKYWVQRDGWPRPRRGEFFRHVAYTPLVGGVAQWLKRRSLTGELSLIYAWSVVDMWLIRG